MSRLYRLLAHRPLTLPLVLLPIGVFFVYFFVLRYNIPWFDEYENIPYFLDRFLNAHSFADGMAALLRPNNEHRVLYARLVVLGQYWLTGGLNFAGLMLWGNLGLVLIFWLLYSALRRADDPSIDTLTTRPLGDKALTGMLPVPLLLFTAQNYLLTFTAIYTLQYLAIIMLVVLTFYVLATDRPLQFGLALGLGLLSTFSMGNGLLLWPAGAVMLVVQRRWVPLAVWLVVGGLGGYLYFLDYPVQQGNVSGFAYVLEHPVQTLSGFLIFAGSVFDLFPMLATEPRSYLPFVMGLVLIVGLGYWLIRTVFRAQKNTSFFDVFVLGCVLFVLANIGLIAVFRIRFYFGMVLHSSYRTYSLVLWSLAVVLLFSRLHESLRVRLWPGLWLLFLGVSVLTYATYIPEAIERRKHMQAMTFNQRHTGIGLGGTRNTYLARYISGLTKLMHDKGWYDLPDPAITPDEKRLIESADPPVPTEPLQITQRPDYIIVNNYDAHYQIGINMATYLIMKSDKHTYLVLAARIRPEVRQFWLVIPGFTAAMPAALLQPGRYRIGLFRTYPDHTQTQFTNRFVDMP